MFFDLLDESKNVAAFAATKALEEAFFGVDVKGRRLFIVKRAQSLVGVTGALEHDRFGDDLEDARPAANFRYYIWCDALQEESP